MAMLTTDAPMPAVLLAVNVTAKFPASVGMPLMTPLVELKARPGGKPTAVKPNGVFAAVTVKLNGWPKKPTALNALVMAAGALEVPV